MMEKLAFDRSMRRYDQDGRLHVDMSNISKAMVNPYKGSEIPNCEQLGLDPDKIYYLLRDPAELEKAAQTFKNLQLLIIHVPVNAKESQKTLTIGCIGSDVVYEHPYLRSSLCIWDAEGIAAVESEEQEELSSSYHYDADMTAGEYEGHAYDGVMRNIRGNHVALVDVGRAGRDVVVSDQDPFIERNVMSKLKQGAKPRITAAVSTLQTKLAQDGDIDVQDVVAIVGALNGEVEAEPVVAPAGDNEPENAAMDADGLLEFLQGKLSDEDLATATQMLSGQAADEFPDGEKPAEDEEPEAPEGGAQKPAQDRALKRNFVSRVAMDSAITAAVTKAKADAHALAQAQKDVAHLVGDVAMDSAEAVYKFTLEQQGVDVKGVHPSAYRSMVGMLKSQPKKLGMDSKGASDAAAMFPNLTRFGKA
jgi:hypothetical protein